MPQNSDGEILVVDDDPLTRKILVRTLASAGYKCREAESGLVAWDRVHDKQPSLLILDLAMPDLNGAELLKRLRSDQNPDIAQIPVIMLTGHGDEDSEILCLEAGADDFVTKPIKGAVLRARIETQLRLRLMRRQLQQQNDELEAWRRNLERDLAAARLTQQSLIPNKPPNLPGWDVASCFRPVIQVGMAKSRIRREGCVSFNPMCRTSRWPPGWAAAPTNQNAAEEMSPGILKSRDSGI